MKVKASIKKRGQTTKLLDVKENFMLSIRGTQETNRDRVKQNG